jgi:hypothetical protein
MAVINCKLTCHSNSPHLSQIFTGFALLHRAGVITLSQECGRRNRLDVAKPQHLRDARDAHLLVTVNDKLRLYYDTHDSYEIDEEAAKEVDCYFKRSYARPKIPASLVNKVFPLGFNYELYPGDPDDFESQRRHAFKQDRDGAQPPPFRPTPETMYSAPEESLPPQVLFMTRAWDPFDNSERPDEKIKERVRLNETRARIIELLRQEFGDDFLGGFSHTDYAVRNYGPMLLPDAEISAKENYVRVLGSYPICVATAGLHGSIGWKMGEYVAFSRAIVSETMTCQVPGDFKEGRNYLRFDTAERCVDAARELFSDAGMRRRIMKANHEYYLSRLKPEAMIKMTLEIGLSERTSKIA